MLNDIYGEVYVGGTFTALARVVDWSSNPLTIEQTSTVQYTITDPNDDNVTGHTNVSLTVADVLYDTLQPWDQDVIGCDFIWTIDVSENAAFAIAGQYRVVFTIQPISGQVVIVRYIVIAC